MSNSEAERRALTFKTGDRVVIKTHDIPSWRDYNPDRGIYGTVQENRPTLRHCVEIKFDGDSRTHTIDNAWFQHVPKRKKSSPQELDLEALYEKALAKWGVDAQMAMAQEECAELIVAISHYQRGRSKDWLALASEIADVQNMMAQLERIVGPALVARYRKSKMARLARRLA